MKKIIYSLSISVMVILGAGSCSDFLNSTTPSRSTPDLVFENADLTYRALLGVYDGFASDAVYSQYISIIFSCGSDIEIRSYSNPISTDREPAHYLAKPDNNRTTPAWETLYQSIERANMVIAGIEGSAIYNDANHEYNTEFRIYRAEAITMRALCYMELCRHWGNVPFKTEPTKPDLSNVYLPKTDRMEIFEALVEQLTDCAEDLPWKQLTPERGTRGFAHGLAARLALYRAGWDFTKDAQWVAPRSDAAKWYKIARDQCEIVMESGEYWLENTYFDYFYKQCQRQYSPNESLYEIGFQVARSSELGYTNGVRYRVATAKYGYTTQGQIQSTPAYFFSFHPNDDRRDITVVYYQYNDLSVSQGITGAYGVSRELHGNAHEFVVNKWSNKWAPDDFHAASLAAGNKTGTGINYPIMRYSDVLLMFAEAEFQLNGATSDAVEALWTVRKRAVPSLSRADFDTYIAGDFMQAVKDERMWEFGGESHRKFDLMRWGELVDAIKNMRTENADLITNWETYSLKFPTFADGSPRQLPTKLYYKYDENNEDFVDINLDRRLDASPGGDYIESDWMWGRYVNGSSAATNRENSIKYWNETCTGIVDVNGTAVSGGRPFQPVPKNAVDSSNGTLGQDYGFNF